MDWKNLKINKCPKCGKDFMIGLATIKIPEGILMGHKCGFQIREKRYKEIISDMVGRQIDREYDDPKEMPLR